MYTVQYIEIKLKDEVLRHKIFNGFQLSLFYTVKKLDARFVGHGMSKSAPLLVKLYTSS